MNLTDKELEIMWPLWDSGKPMTVAEIIAATPNKTWQESSIYTMTKVLRSKGAVAVDHHVPTTGRSALAFKATLTKEEYVALRVLEFEVDIPKLISAIEASTIQTKSMCREPKSCDELK